MLTTEDKPYRRVMDRADKPIMIAVGIPKVAHVEVQNVLAGVAPAADLQSLLDLGEILYHRIKQ
jgi:hypothetical protein